MQRPPPLRIGSRIAFAIRSINARADVGVAYMRFMAASPDWEQAPQKVTVPNTEATIMGEYFPQSQYMSRAEFEAFGCATP